MICASCKYSFCWFCLEITHGHNSTCAKYDQEKKTNKKLIKAEQVIEENKAILALYQNVFERFMQHQKSKDAVIKQLPKIEKNVILLHEVKNYP